jgi:16S rRNA (adenine1518-N6/adenine1519-N6)-dimethyltransferase
MLRANKALGQHFLHNQQVLARIAAACGPLQNKPVLEIGPGPGALTRHLLTAGAHVTALEKDPRFLDGLSQLPGTLTLYQADALDVNLSSFTPPGSLVVGNLPYNVGTEIVFRLIQHHRHHFSHMLFLLQKEVVQRICARPGTKDWGRLGVWCDLLCERQALFDVAPGAFTPPPKVTSSLVRLTPLPAPRYQVREEKLAHLLNLVFTQRRKMLRRSLKGHLPESDIEDCGIAPTQRPEELTTEQLCHLANKIS